MLIHKAGAVLVVPCGTSAQSVFACNKVRIVKGGRDTQLNVMVKDVVNLS